MSEGSRVRGLPGPLSCSEVSMGEVASKTLDLRLLARLLDAVCCNCMGHRSHASRDFQ